ncbi:hypothetical protein [Paenibacillus harenae]|uniref:hypothetical protein n=1 Tax=Paenibacillus harenae TaxID=306543 RepID=UPI0027D7EDD1|nr:hypothetical protein [Paenibacillus harenae]
MTKDNIPVLGLSEREAIGASFFSYGCGITALQPCRGTSDQSIGTVYGTVLSPLTDTIRTISAMSALARRLFVRLVE